MDPLKMYFLLKSEIFHGYVSLPEGNSIQNTYKYIGSISALTRWTTILFSKLRALRKYGWNSAIQWGKFAPQIG